MHDKIESLAFWRTVKEEFSNTHYDFLCHGSETFKEVWIAVDSRLELKLLANRFLVEEEIDRNIGVPFSNVYFGVLFYTEYFHEDRSIRTQFINWNIKRLSRK